MKLLLCSILLSMSVSLYAQHKQAPRLPVNDETKLVTYSKVIELPGLSQDILYHRALDWCNTFYKNPADVIREKDSVTGKIICKARYKISDPPDKKGFSTDAGAVMYTLELMFKDGRYKYSLTEINWKQQSYFPVEKWMDKSSQSYLPEFDFYLQQVDERSHEIIRDLDQAMKREPKIKKDDW